MKVMELFGKIKREMTLLSLGLLAFSLIVLSFLLVVQNKKVKDLQMQLVIRTAKLELEKLLAKHDVAKDEISRIRQESAVVKQDIERLEMRLTQKLSPNMTAEEIAAKFREIGL